MRTCSLSYSWFDLRALAKEVKARGEQADDVPGYEHLHESELSVPARGELDGDEGLRPSGLLRGGIDDCGLLLLVGAG
jgi:hypothetical protein